MPDHAQLAAAMRYCAKVEKMAHSGCNGKYFNLQNNMLCRLFNFHKLTSFFISLRILSETNFTAFHTIKRRRLRWLLNE